MFLHSQCACQQHTHTHLQKTNHHWATKHIFLIPQKDIKVAASPAEEKQESQINQTLTSHTSFPPWRGKEITDASKALLGKDSKTKQAYLTYSKVEMSTKADSFP